MIAYALCWICTATRSTIYLSQVYTCRMQMEKLCEDELMHIQKYTPMAEIGVSNERLYNEIKLLDPTFDMTRIYDQLLLWRRLMERNNAYPLHRVFSNHKICEKGVILEGGDHVYTFMMRSKDGDIHRLQDDLLSIGYDTVLLDSTIYRTPIAYNRLAMSVRPRDAVNLRKIDQAMLHHPIRNLQYRADRCDRIGSAYGYNARDHVHSDIDTADLPDRYDHDLYTDIRAIDPTINMNVLYDVYVRKYERETRMWKIGPHTMSVRDMYNICYPYLGAIEHLVMNMDKGQLEIVSNIGSNIRPLIEIMPIWSRTMYGNIHAYTGPDMDIMYDNILTMLRIYYSYSIPNLQYMSARYYDD